MKVRSCTGKTEEIWKTLVWTVCLRTRISILRITIRNSETTINAIRRDVSFP